jgi:hypothetical protein
MIVSKKLKTHTIMPTSNYRELQLSEPTAIFGNIDFYGLSQNKMDKPIHFILEAKPTFINKRGLFFCQGGVYTNFELSDKSLGSVYFPIPFEKDYTFFNEFVAKASTNKIFTAVFKIGLIKKSTPKVFFEEDLFEE